MRNTGKNIYLYLCVAYLTTLPVVYSI